MVDAPLKKVLVGGLRRGEEMLGNSAAELTAVGGGEQVEEGDDGLIHIDAPGRQIALTRRGIGYGCHARHSKAVNQRLEGGEEEGLVFADRPARGDAELIALERRDGV